MTPIKWRDSGAVFCSAATVNFYYAVLPGNVINAFGVGIGELVVGVIALILAMRKGEL